MLSRADLISKFCIYSPLLRDEEPKENVAIIHNGQITEEPPNFIEQTPVNQQPNGNEFPFLRPSLPVKRTVTGPSTNNISNVLAKDIPCNVCYKTYKSKYWCENHTNEFRMQLKCCVCKNQFPDEKTLRDHRAEFAYKYHCCGCMKRKTEELFKKHASKCKPQRSSMDKDKKDEPPYKKAKKN